MDRDAVLKVIRGCFAHVEVERIVVEFDPLIGVEIAKVVVRDDQLTEALRGNGEHARQAAMKSGLNVEVVLPSE